LGKQSITGYDKDGNQKILSISERDDPTEAMKAAGLSLERSRLFYSTNAHDEFSPVLYMGRFNSIEEARESGIADSGLGSVVMDLEETLHFSEFRNQSLSNADREVRTTLAQDQFRFTKQTTAKNFELSEENLELQKRRLELSEEEFEVASRLARERFDFQKGGGSNPFAQLQASIESGALTEEQGAEAWKRLTHIWGRTEPDVKLSYLKKLEPEGAQIHAMSGAAVRLMELVADDPGIITGAARIPAAFNKIGAEINALAGELGWSREKIETGKYDAAFERLGLGSKSVAFKNLLTDWTLMLAAASGQEGRSLSDKDFDRFLTISGTDISDAPTFIFNMNSLMVAKQRQFEDRYTSLTLGDNWAASHGAFPQYGSNADKADTVLQQWLDVNPELKDLIILPKGAK